MGVANAWAYWGSRFRGSYDDASATGAVLDLDALSNCFRLGVVLKSYKVVIRMRSESIISRNLPRREDTDHQQ